MFILYFSVSTFNLNKYYKWDDSWKQIRWGRPWCDYILQVVVITVDFKSYKLSDLNFIFSVFMIFPFHF